MSYIHIKKTKSGNYHYRVESYWDKKLQQPRQCSVYIGKEDPATGEVKPIHDRLRTTTPDRVLDYGHVAVCRFLAERQGLLPALRNAFDADTAELVFLLGVFLIAEELPLYVFERWIEGVTHEFKGKKSSWASKGISALLQRLGENNGARLRFQQEVAFGNREAGCTALIDATSISTYSALDGWAAWGHNRDGESLPQVNLQLASLEPGGFPVALRMIEGSIPDVSTLLNAIKLLQSLDIKEPRVVVDRGYFSKANLERLALSGAKVLIPVPAHNTLFAMALATYGKSMKKASNAFTDHDDTFYHVAFDTEHAGQKYRAHLYLNQSRQVAETGRFFAQIERAERDFAAEPPRSKREAFARLAELLPKSKIRLLRVVGEPDGDWRIERKAKAIARQLNRLGYILIITDDVELAGLETLSTYRSRDAVEKLFDNLKNALELDRLRVHSAETAEGKLFVALIAMMLHSLLQKSLAASKQELGRRVCPREALVDFRRIKLLTLPDGSAIVSELCKRQRIILRLLGVPEAILTSESPSSKNIPN